MNGPYDDIIHLPHHSSLTRPRMSARDRAAQFSPFAALNGHEAAICETARLTQQRPELAEDSRAELNRRLQTLADWLPEPVTVTVTYFQPDARKPGGHRTTVTGQLRRFDRLRRCMVLADRTEIPLEDLLAVDSSLWVEADD